MTDYIDLDEVFEEEFERPDDCYCAETLLSSTICHPCLNAGFDTPNPEGRQ